MAYTGHGHHIPNTPLGKRKPMSVARCGGVQMCPRCKKDVQDYFEGGSASAGYIHPLMNGREDLQKKAKNVVRQAMENNVQEWDASLPDHDLHVIRFSKVLQNWEALVVTTMLDDMIYKVYYNGDRQETYVEAYRKVHHTVIPDIP